MEENKVNMFGKVYTTIGSSDSNFIIKTKGDLKIQWGNKFIDLIKDGNISIENQVQQLLDLLIPQGTIVMWNGDSIPEGWALCDGTKGTPNLIGSFIKASNVSGEGSVKTLENDITLKSSSMDSKYYSLIFIMKISNLSEEI